MHTPRNISALVLSLALATPAFAAPKTDGHVAFTKTIHTESPIIVTERRATDDELVTRDVVDALANDASLAGRIGVQTTDGEVELSGIVAAPGQRRQAERDARSVDGVRNVRNLLSTRVGAGRF